MPSHRPTLLDVAQRAGVSRTTASFVLTGRQDMRISADARDRVLRAASELDYRPNLMARGLRTKITHTIALISDTIATDQYAGQVVYGSLAAAVEHQRLLFVGETEGDRQIEARLIEEFLSRQVDGFIYAAMFTRSTQIPRALRGHPLVLLNCISRNGAVPAVVPDELNAGRAAADALLDAGHRDRIFLVGERAPDTFAYRERLAGIEQALGEVGARLAGRLECKWWPESAYEAVTRFLRDGGRPAAFICLNDRIAFGTYQALHEVSLDIPAEVSVVSFDDSDLASWMRPQLTSVAIPHYALGRRAVELLLNSPPAAGIERLHMPLRSRSSIGPPKDNG